MTCKKHVILVLRNGQTVRALQRKGDYYKIDHRFVRIPKGEIAYIVDQRGEDKYDVQPSERNV